MGSNVWHDDLLAGQNERRERDKARYETLPNDKCMACGAEGPDMRSLTIACGYVLAEAVPEMIDLFKVNGTGGWYLRICKSCRGAFIQHLAQWFDERKQRRGLEMDTNGGDL